MGDSPMTKVKTVLLTMVYTTGGQDSSAFNASMTALINAVCAYRASLEPEGVDPSTVAPGTRFRFAAPVIAYGTGPYLLVALGNGERRWLNSNSYVLRFDPSHRIIPLN